MRVRNIKYRPLMLHQGNYQKHAAKSDHNACLLEMRLGKTLATIRWLVSLPKQACMPILVVAPLSVLEAWEKELTLEYERYVIASGLSFNKRTELVIEEAFGQEGRTWVLINYDCLRATPGLAFLEWYGAVIDESTTIKNPKAKITKLVTKGFRDTKHRTILAGLPRPESELDLFTQFQFLYGSFMNCRNYYDYRNRYFELKWNGWEPKPGMAKIIKDEVHNKAFILTRKSAGLGSTKVRERRMVTMSPDQARVYNKIEDKFVAEYGIDLLLETDHVLTQRMWLARIAGGAEVTGKAKWLGKINELLFLLKGELASEPVVVWFRFTSEIHAAAEALRKAAIPFQTLTGADSRQQRKDKQDWFRTSKQPGRVMLVQIIKVAEYGVDMSVSSTAIYYSVTYSCLQMAQTEDRIMHPMKKEPLLYIYLVSKDSIDEDAVETVSKKLTNAKMFQYKMRSLFETRRNK